MRRLPILCFFALAAGSTGCLWIAAGAEGGYVAGQKDRSVGETMSDQLLFTKVKAALLGAEKVDSGRIEVTVRKSAATLTGVVPSADQKARALAAVKAVDGVKKVVDKLFISK